MTPTIILSLCLLQPPAPERMPPDVAPAWTEPRPAEVQVQGPVLDWMRAIFAQVEEWTKVAAHFLADKGGAVAGRVGDRIEAGAEWTRGVAGGVAGFFAAVWWWVKWLLIYWLTVRTLEAVGKLRGK